MRLLAIVVALSLAACSTPRRSTPAPPLPTPAISAIAGAWLEQADGWTILHAKGSPDEIGYAHGYLLAERIDDAIRAVKLDLEHDGSFREDWAFLKDATQRICWPKVPPDLRAEIGAIARGVQARGYSYDWQDILTLNAHIEMASYWLPMHRERTTGITQPSRAPEACSAFVATGSATTDGRIVMGQNFWWGYLTGTRFNIILDITPATGHRFAMDAMPGFVHSGTDFAINDAGLAICETTIGGFKGFVESGIPEFVRMRRAIQHASSIAAFAAIMREGNNGGYANAWLLADSKSGEIGKLELGLKATPLSTTTDGFYFGANFPEDPAICEFDCGGYQGGHEPRRVRWNALLQENRGRIDGDAARRFLGDTTHANGVGNRGEVLCGRSDLDPSRGFSPGGAVSNRVVTGADLDQPRFWARWGFADGTTFDANEYLTGRGQQVGWQSGMLPDIGRHRWIPLVLPK
ncbi:MAG: peptidase C45 [Planctomycetes bacterium]|nr:peptidase C45 [Planctomycetota bacterium]